MQPDTASTTTPITGRCYCGHLTITASAMPQTVSYCHCVDCRRLSGAPVAAFAAFDLTDIEILPHWPERRSHVAGVDRWFCDQCGSALAAKYDYLPDQIYVPIGILDQAESLRPEMHSHIGSALQWLHIQDDLPKNHGSARDALAAATDQT